MTENINNEVKLQLQTLFNTTFDGVVILENGVIIEVPTTLIEMIGYTDHELVGTPFLNYVKSDDHKKVQEYMQNQGEGSLELSLLKKDGSLLYVEVQSGEYPYEERIVQLITLKNITARKESDMHIEYLAYHDELTGLPNRLSFNQRLKLHMTNAQLKNSSLAVLFCDCDGFKKINDTFGHSMGDLLLKKIANRFQESVSEIDMVSRIGGDEFIILLLDADEEKAGNIARKLIQAFEKPFQLEGNDLFVTTSIGISIYPLLGENTDTLIKNSDIAMFEAKKKGKNRFEFYNPSMSHHTFNLLTLENELRLAVEREEFFLYYQPQIDIKSQEIVGVEALIRWNHREIGMISPAQFIPIAEKSGMILPIGEWVLKTACLQNRVWQENGLPPIRVSVNFSAIQIQQHDFVKRVKEILNETRLEPKYLEIEITELAALENKENVISCFKQLQELGIKVDIDDFGTGYCSFSYLKLFPINKLKIDKSFIRNVQSDKENQAITEAIIYMGKGLGLKVIAEGIETEQELNYLIDLNCDEGQGYYYSRPLPNEEFVNLLSNRKAFPVEKE